MQLATRAIKEAHPDLLVITDLCLCEYTSHGHCGVAARATGASITTQTLELLARIAVSQARAGADIVAPSDMMDGRVGAIRGRARRGRARATSPSWPTRPSSPPPSTGRFARRPTRAPAFGDRRGYQMDPANGREARARGAARRRARAPTSLMVKPAVALSRRDPPRSRTPPRLPLAAYNVSGEYAMVKAAAAAGLPRRARDRARDADLHPAGRSRHRSSPTTPRMPPDGCSRHPGGSQHGPSCAAARTASAVPLDELDKRLLNLMQGSFPLAPRPYAARRRGRPGPRGESCSTGSSG